MKQKNLIISIIILTLIYLLIVSLNKPKIFSNTPFTRFIDIKKIKQIKIKDNSNETLLEKKDNKWYLTYPYNYRADDIEIENIINRIATSKLFGPLTRNRELYKRFEIYPETSTYIEIFSDKKVSFVTGKATSDMSGTFIKFGDNDSIYEAKGIFPFDFKKKSDDLIYKNIMEFKENEINSISVKYNDKELMDSKSDNKWLKNYSQNIIDILKLIRFSKIEKINNPVGKTSLEITLKSSYGEEKIYFKKEKFYLAFKNNYKLNLDEPNSKKIDEIINQVKQASR